LLKELILTMEAARLSDTCHIPDCHVS